MEETADNQACSFSGEMDSSEKAEIITGSRGGSVLLANNQRYHSFQQNGDKVQWRCVNKGKGCNARAVTEKEYLMCTAGTHTCGESKKEAKQSIAIQMMKSKKNDSESIEKEKKQPVHQAGPSIKSQKEEKLKFEFITGKKGSRILVIKKNKYRCQKKKGKKQLWSCVQRHCHATAIIEDGCLMKTTGVHICGGPRNTTQEFLKDKKENLNNNFKIGKEAKQLTQQRICSFESSEDGKSTSVVATITSGIKGGQILSFGSHKYHAHTRTNDKVYWRCVQKGCNANATTRSDSLLSTRGVHVCAESSEETERLLEDGNPKSSISSSASESKESLDQACSFSRGTKGGTIMSHNNNRYSCSKRCGDKAYWQCVSKGCPATAKTFRKHLTKIYAAHVCDKQSEEILKKEEDNSFSSAANETIEFPEEICSENSKENFSRTLASIISGRNGGLVLLVNNKRYHRRRKLVGDQQLWQCTRKGCYATAITVNNILMSVSGIHACDNPSELTENTINSVLLSTEKSVTNEELNCSTASEENDEPEIACSFTKGARGGIVLVANNYRYYLNSRNGDMVYWQCADKRCKATAKTFQKKLERASSVHTCGERVEATHQPLKDEEEKSSKRNETKQNASTISTAADERVESFQETSSSSDDSKEEELVDLSTKITSTSKGGLRLLLNEYLYFCHCRNKEKIYWRCIQKSCSARLISLNNRLLCTYGAHANDSCIKEASDFAKNKLGNSSIHSFSNKGKEKKKTNVGGNFKPENQQVRKIKHKV